MIFHSPHSNDASSISKQAPCRIFCGGRKITWWDPGCKSLQLPREFGWNVGMAFPTSDSVNCRDVRHLSRNCRNSGFFKSCQASELADQTPSGTYWQSSISAGYSGSWDATMSVCPFFKPDANAFRLTSCAPFAICGHRQVNSPNHRGRGRGIDDFLAPLRECW